jgi:hypothetical protein
MLKVDQDLTRVLMLQESLGVRQTTNFDSDAKAMSGPAVGMVRGLDSLSTTDPAKVAVTVRLKLDPKSGEYLGV